jgi:hypothetical protein
VETFGKMAAAIGSVGEYWELVNRAHQVQHSESIIGISEPDEPQLKP